MLDWEYPTEYDIWEFFTWGKLMPGISLKTTVGGGRIVWDQEQTNSFDYNLPDLRPAVNHWLICAKVCPWRRAPTLYCQWRWLRKWHGHVRIRLKYEMTSIFFWSWKVRLRAKSQSSACRQTQCEQKTLCHRTSNGNSFPMPRLGWNAIRLAASPTQSLPTLAASHFDFSSLLASVILVNFIYPWLKLDPRCLIAVIFPSCLYGRELIAGAVLLKLVVAMTKIQVFGIRGNFVGVSVRGAN